MLTNSPTLHIITLCEQCKNRILTLISNISKSVILIICIACLSSKNTLFNDCKKQKTHHKLQIWKFLSMSLPPVVKDEMDHRASRSKIMAEVIKWISSCLWRVRWEWHYYLTVCVHQTNNSAFIRAQHIIQLLNQTLRQQNHLRKLTQPLQPPLR